MQIREPRLRALLSQAERNAAYGKMAAAETMYRQILDEAPDSEEAWLGLAAVLSDPDAQRAAYERVLTLAPTNEAAIEGLNRLDGHVVATVEEPAVATALPVTATAATNIYPDVSTNSTVVPQLEPETETELELFCYRHPDRSTSLRCYNCNRPICISCANKTPVGYICPECRRQAEDAFFNNKPIDYIIAILVSLPISLLAGFLMVNFLSRGFLFFILIFFISGAVGSFIGRITKRAVGGRRGRYLPGLVVAMMIVGVVIPALPVLASILLGNVGGLVALIGPGIYLFVGCGAAYWQMR